MSPRIFDIIVAINNESLIGIKEYGSCSMPWPMLKEDMEYFKNITTKTTTEKQKNAIIVGYNTWLSLPNFYKKNTKRLNIVISRSFETDISNYNEVYVSTFDQALKYASIMDNIDNILVIGGATIYNIALSHPSLRKIYLTHIHHSYPFDIVVEQKIYFPFSHKHLDNFVTNGHLCLNDPIKNIYDTNKNIIYCFKIYDVQNDFDKAYQNTNKIPRIEYCKNLPLTNLSNRSDGEYQYLNMVYTIMKNGLMKQTRNGITKSIFGYQLRFDLSEGYPLATVKRSYPKAIFEELMWIIRGETNVKKLQEKNVHIWDKNSSKEFLSNSGLSYNEGDIGPGYGFQMRYYGAKYIDCLTDYTGKGVDQLQNCIKMINQDPHSRRIIIDLWNCMDVEKMALPCCHVMYNFSIDLYDKPLQNGSKGKLNCHLFQRSWDVLLGWNTTTAALFTYILANHCYLDPGILVHSISDAHLYKTHIDSGVIDELLSRIPRKFPTLKFLKKRDNIEDYVFEDIVLENYYPCPAIIAEMVA